MAIIPTGHSPTPACCQAARPHHNHTAASQSLLSAAPRRPGPTWPGRPQTGAQPFIFIRPGPSWLGRAGHRPTRLSFGSLGHWELGVCSQPVSVCVHIEHQKLQTESGAGGESLVTPGLEITSLVTLEAAELCPTWPG